MKPDDVSQEAWDAAQSRALEVAATALRNLEQDDFAIEVHAIRCGIARAIMAETERCAVAAKEAALCLRGWPVSEEQANEIAAAIRGTPQ